MKVQHYTNPQNRSPTMINNTTIASVTRKSMDPSDGGSTKTAGFEQDHFVTSYNGFSKDTKTFIKGLIGRQNKKKICFDIEPHGCNYPCFPFHLLSINDMVVTSMRIIAGLYESRLQQSPYAEWCELSETELLERICPVISRLYGDLDTSMSESQYNKANSWRISAAVELLWMKHKRDNIEPQSDTKKVEVEKPISAKALRSLINACKLAERIENSTFTGKGKKKKLERSTSLQEDVGPGCGDSSARPHTAPKVSPKKTSQKKWSRSDVPDWRKRDHLEPQGYLDSSMSFDEDSKELLKDFTRTLKETATAVSHPEMSISQDTLSRVEKMMSGLTAMQDRQFEHNLTPESIDGIRRVIKSIDVSINHESPAFGHMLSSFKDSLSTTSSYAFKLVCVILFFWALSQVRESDSNPTYKKVAYSVIILLGLVGVGVEVTGLMKTLLGHFSNSKEEIKPESGYVDTVSKIVCAFFAKTVFSNLKSENVVYEFFHKNKDIQKIHDSTKFMFESTLALLERFVNFIGSKFGMRHLVLTEGLYPEVTAYHSEVANTIATFYSGRILDWASGQEILELNKKGHNLLKSLPNTAHSRDARISTTRILGELKPLLAKLERANITGNGPRREPLGIMITGPSGVGKSTVTTPLILGVTAAILEGEKLAAFEKNHNDFIYNRIFETIFWDGYHSQTNVCFDDIGQIVDVPGVANNSYMEGVRTINTSNYQLHMAELMDKGNTNFNSELVWATSNVRKWKLSSIKDTEAFTRRFVLSYLAVPKLEYCTPESIANKTGDLWERRLKPLDKLDETFQHMEFYHTNLLTGELVDQKAMSYEEVRDEIIATYKVRKGFGEKVLGLHTKIKKDALNKRPDYVETTDDVKAESPCGEDNARHNSNLWFDMDPDELWSTVDKSNEWASRVRDIFRSRTFRNSDEKELLDNIMGAQKNCFAEIYERLFEHLCKFPNGDIADIITPPTGVESLPKWQKIKSWTCDQHRRAVRFVATSMNALAEEWSSYRDRFTGCVKSAITYVALIEFIKPMKAYRDYFTTNLRMEKTKFRNTLLAVGAILGVATMGYAAYKMFKGSNEEAPAVGEVELEAVADSVSNPIEQSSSRSIKEYKKPTRSEKRVQTRKDMAKYMLRSSRRAESDVKCDILIAPQSADERVVTEVGNKIFRKAMYAMLQPGRTTPSGYFTFVFGHVAMVPMHILERLFYDVEKGAIKPGEKIRFYRLGAPEVKFEIDPRHFKVFEREGDCDLAFVLFPNVVPRAPDMEKFFSEERISPDSLIDTVLVRPSDNGNFEPSVARTSAVRQIEYGDYSFDRGYRYSLTTKVGDCGSVLLTMDPSTGCARVLGIHTAGGSGSGFAVSVSRSDIRDAKAMIGPEEVYDEPGFYDGPSLSNDCLPDAQGYVILTDEEPVHNPVTTVIIPSPLKDTYCESLMKPAHLKKFKHGGKELDPWQIARADSPKLIKYMDPRVLKLSFDSYFSKIFAVSTDDVPWKPRPYTFEEAVAGIDGVPFADGIPRSTSSGYPWSLSIPQGFKGKQHFFGREGPYEFTSPYCAQLRGRVEDVIAHAKKGLRLKHVFIDFLKDERRFIEKVDRGKTRMISAAPLDLVVAMRMYFLDMCRWLMRNRVRNGSAIGINPYGDEWDIFGRALSAVTPGPDSENYIAGDYSKYDRCQSRQVMVYLLALADRYYGPVDSLVRKTLCEEVMNSKHLCQTFIYEVAGELPSGVGLTSFQNTIDNGGYIRYAAFLCYLNDKYGSMDTEKVTSSDLLQMQYLEKNMCIVCFGDDNVIAVSDAVKSYITQENLTVALETVGMTYTDEMKSTKVVQHRRLGDISFLKRGFRFVRGITSFLAPLDIVTILEMAQWKKKKDVNNEAVRDTLFTAIKELSLHPKEVFDEHFESMVRAALDHLNYVPPITDYDTLQVITRGMETPY